tara:strand:+ start:209 stop:412 length:204 start_codon:yes stop_codon:yes gene_type:complete
MAKKSDKVIIYHNDEGGISIIGPADKSILTLEQIQAKCVPSGKTSYIVNRSELPTDRTFRNAWTYTP